MRILVIGYGNPSRRDDGVGLVVVNGLRQRLGLLPLAHNDDGYGYFGHDVDTLFLQQLMPELAETIANYDWLFFVDAHVGIFPELIRHERLAPNPERAIVSHHVKPAALLEIAAKLYGRAPRVELISIRGYDFDFGDEVSLESAGGASDVVAELWRRCQAGETA